jgi:hypothetical protein
MKLAQERQECATARTHTQSKFIVSKLSPSAILPSKGDGVTAREPAALTPRIESGLAPPTSEPRWLSTIELDLSRSASASLMESGG